MPLVSHIERRQLGGGGTDQDEVRCLLGDDGAGPGHTGEAVSLWESLLP